VKHWFLSPSLHDPFYVCGGMQIFHRAFDLVSQVREAERITYRHREDGVRYLDDVDPAELEPGLLWVTWQAHVTELAQRLARFPRVVLYAQNTDFGPDQGQATPPRWPVVCLSRYIAGDMSLREPWRLLLNLPPVLHSAARNTQGKRDIDVLVHHRKGNHYLLHELVPALQERLRVEVLDRWMPQEELFAWLNRSRVYLYWMHRQVTGVLEGFGMQPLEAMACGATPVSNIYGGLSDYLEPPWNSRKIGVHSLAYDVLQIQCAVEEYDGRNPDEERVLALYGEQAFHERFARVESELLFYFEHCPEGPHQEFAVAPPAPPLLRRPYIWLHRQVRRRYKRMKGILPR
jgi:glycosyltransferase involved in cell wall biosynthesis